ncbi:MAG: alpha/beta hydrolase fold domain-containing protein, partial [Clostridia bacterium]|nr:alpha/beta hydrolase fold domain-containing protein [Clostridia bacterium]
MAIIERTAWSAEMEKNANTVGKMTGGASFAGDVSNRNWKVLRVICDLGYSLMPKEKGVKVQKLNLDGIYGEMTLPKKQASENIIFYIHGGGLVSGSAKATRAYCSMMAKYSGCRVVSIDYALAPENHHPSALNDCEKAFLALRKQFPKAKFAVQGESAGGYLTIALTIRMIETGHQPPECIIPHSPVCDFTGET